MPRTVASISESEFYELKDIIDRVHRRHGTYAAVADALGGVASPSTLNNIANSRTRSVSSRLASSIRIAAELLERKQKPEARATQVEAATNEAVEIAKALTLEFRRLARVKADLLIELEGVNALIESLKRILDPVAGDGDDDRDGGDDPKEPK